MANDVNDFTDETHVEFIETSITWKVRSVKSLAKLTQKGDFLIGKCFYNSKYPKIKWKLKIYPNGILTTDKKWCSGFFVSLIHVGLNDDGIIRAEYDIYTIKSNGEAVNIIHDAEDFKNLSRTSLFVIDMHSSPRNDGSILIACEIKFLPPNLESKHTSNDDYSFNLKEMLQNMLKQEIFTDCVIYIGDEEINAHRCILAQNSEVFRRMFEQNGMIEGQSGIVKIDDCTSECFRVMLEYCYTGNVSRDALETINTELFAVAHKYELTQLKKKCELFMASNVNAENIENYCRIIDIYDVAILEEACSKYIQANLKCFLNSTGLKEFRLAFGNMSNSFFKLLLSGNCIY